MGGSTDTREGLASQPRRYRVPRHPLLNRWGVRPAAQLGSSTTRLVALQGHTNKEGIGAGNGNPNPHLQ